MSKFELRNRHLQEILVYFINLKKSAVAYGGVAFSDSEKFQKGRKFTKMQN